MNSFNPLHFLVFHYTTFFPNELNQGFEVEGPNEVWVIDITKIHTGEGFLYLNPIIDLYSRRIISYRTDEHLEHELCLNALKEAIALRQLGEGWMHHSDRGSQYCANAYLSTFKQVGTTISMSRKAMPYENACI